MAYYQQPPPDERPGCMDAVVITRAVFGLLFWPFAALIAGLADLFVIVWLFTVHPALALIPIAATAAVVYAFALWERRRDEDRMRM